MTYTNLYLSVPSRVFGIIRIGHGLVMDIGSALMHPSGRQRYKENNYKHECAILQGSIVHSDKV